MIPQRESLPAVTAAGVVAVIFASLGILGCGLLTMVMLMMPNIPNNSGASHLPEATRMMAIGVYFLFFLICVAELVVAINVIRRKNWARIAIIVWASIMAFFSAVSCVAVFFVMNFVPQTEPARRDPGFLLFMKAFLLVLYGIPFSVGVWWLILFNRPRVAAAFKAAFPIPAVAWAADSSGFPAPLTSPPLPVDATPRKPSCPIPLVVVSVILLISAVFSPIILLLPHSSATPFFLFGFVASHSIGKYFFAVLSLIYGVMAIGTIRLRPQALDAMIALQALFLINGLLSIASPGFLHALQDAMQRNAMTNPALPNGLPFLSYDFVRGMMIGGTAFSSAVLGILVGFRDRFRKAAAEAGS